jgi:hypothetical protein
MWLISARMIENHSKRGVDGFDAALKLFLLKYLAQNEKCSTSATSSSSEFTTLESSLPSNRESSMGTVSQHDCFHLTSKARDELKTPESLLESSLLSREAAHNLCDGV